MSGTYSFVPLESNESGDEDVVNPGIRYTFHWTADKNGFNSNVTQTVDNGQYGYDELPPISTSDVNNQNGSYSYGYININSPMYQYNELFFNNCLYFFRYESPNGIQISVNGHQEGENGCCPCRSGTIMKGAYTFVPIQSNEDDEKPIIDPIRYVVKWVADVNGFQPVVIQQPLSDDSYNSDELYA